MANKSSPNLLSLEGANKNKLNINWKKSKPVKPSFLGVQELNPVPVDVLRSYIDWTPFFKTWSLAGSYPKILKDKVVGEAATQLFRDANKMLDELAKSKIIKNKSVIGFWPASQNKKNEVKVYKNEKREEQITTLNFPRQQRFQGKGNPNLSLSDFIAPEGIDTKDYIGAFARRGQGGHSGLDSAQGWQVDAGGVGDHAPPPDLWSRRHRPGGGGAG